MDKKLYLITITVEGLDPGGKGNTEDAGDDDNGGDEDFNDDECDDLDDSQDMDTDKVVEKPPPATPNSEGGGGSNQGEGLSKTMWRTRLAPRTVMRNRV
jgi:hypothetical protein